MKQDKTPAILFILLDAFRHDYLNEADAPTLTSLTKSSVRAEKLVSSPGFTQRSTIFTGSMPIDNGNYTMYIFNPAKSPFWLLSGFKGLLRHLPESGLVNRVVRKFINQLPKVFSDWAPPGKIPAHLLPLISVTEDMKPIYKPGNLPVESLFDKMHEKNINYEYLMAPVSGYDQPTMERALNSMNEETPVMFVQFSDTDGQVHKSGVKSQRRHEIVSEADERVRKLVEKFKSVHEDPWVVVVGDHGMVDVHTYIDVWSPIETYALEKNLKNGKDYLMFLDSTLARFWFFTDEARQLLTPKIKEVLKDNGEFITDEYLEQNRIGKNPEWYGELIWRTHESVGIFPDYFHGLDDKYIGMHGYDSNYDSMKGVFLVHHSSFDNEKTVDQSRLADITPTLCDILDLTYPDKNEGVSLLQQK